MMRITSYLGCIVLVLGVLTVPAVAQDASDVEEWTVTTESSEEAQLLEPSFAYGFLHKDGSLAISPDTVGVFCPDLALMIIHPSYAFDVMSEFGAVELDPDHWSIPDPETGDMVTVRVQSAEYTYDDGSDASSKILGEGLAVLPVVAANKVALVPWPYFRFWRLRIHYICGVPGSCPSLPGGCWNGYQYSKLRNFLQCTYQPWALCLEWFHPVCRLTRYTCRDCTGPIVWRRNFGRWVCALY